MKHALIFILSTTLCHIGYSQQRVINQEAEKEIRLVLQKQELAWNNFNLDGFMEGYWKSDLLLFVGSQITKGWTATLEGYKKRYNSQAQMGSLKFEILQIDSLTPEVYVVTGKYFLTRSTTNLDGIFTLLFQRKNGKWVIVYDHTS